MVTGGVQRELRRGRGRTPMKTTQVEGAEGDREDHARDAGGTAAVVPADEQRVEQEEQPDRREPRSAATQGCSCTSVRLVTRGHTRAVSLLIRQAAPATKIANQPTALTTAYQGRSRVSGERAISATPYIGVQ